MPTIPASTVEAINKRQRERFTRLSHERTVLGFSFSFEKLMVELTKHMTEAAAIKLLQKCIAAYTDTELKPIVSGLNEDLISIMGSNKLPASEKGSITVLLEDPFGIMRDVIMLSSKSSTPNLRDMQTYMMSHFKLSAKQFEEAKQASIKSTPYTTIQVRAHKESGGGDEDAG